MIDETEGKAGGGFSFEILLLKITRDGLDFTGFQVGNLSATIRNYLPIDYIL
jgi:hypothetical protein